MNLRLCIQGPAYGLRQRKPGESFTSSVVATYDDVFATPSGTLSCTVSYPDGTLDAPLVVTDGVGFAHAVAAVPAAMIPGVGVERWQVTGSGVDQQALAERRFFIDPLDF
jgi:hypothetical protein